MPGKIRAGRGAETLTLHGSDTFESQPDRARSHWNPRALGGDLPEGSAFQIRLRGLLGKSSCSPSLETLTNKPQGPGSTPRELALPRRTPARNGAASTAHARQWDPGPRGQQPTAANRSEDVTMKR